MLKTLLTWAGGHHDRGHDGMMGRYSPPVNGAVTANGHKPALAPFTIPAAMQDGPISPWPQPASPGRWRHAVSVMTAHRGWLAAIPVILVNVVAFGAQLGFWRTHVPLLAEAVLVALALESAATYLAWQAHLAKLADDSALRLLLAAYGMALLIGALNYSHFMLPGWRPTVAAVTFGMMSAISPWLWSVHSRRVSRDALKARGLIEPHAVRLGATRWTWHPLRSAQVMWHATWQGENDPAAAIALVPAATVDDVPVGDIDDDTDDDTDDVPDDGTGHDTDTGSGDDSDMPPDDDNNDGTPPPPDPPKRPRKTATGRDKAIAIMKRSPSLTDADVAKRAGVSERTVQRARAQLAQMEARRT